MEYSIITPSIKSTEKIEDRTAPLTKVSKKTQRRQLKRLRAKRPSQAPTPLDLPAELLHDILTHLTPSEVLRARCLSRNFNAFISSNESSLARSVIRKKYRVLSQSFPLPQPLSALDEESLQALRRPGRKSLLTDYQKGFTHIPSPPGDKICTCPSCIMAWNNLATVLDLHHWQSNLNAREPIPMIPRGQNPVWNVALLARSAAMVEKAIQGHLLTYALILERHLNTIIGGLTRHGNRTPARTPKSTAYPKVLYGMTAADVESGTDEFLEREGRENYEIPYTRDNYYNNNMLAYVPNRKWDKKNESWIYFAVSAHERDLAWLKSKT
ncbi:hypothetical protein K470DRAFT_224060 [Piedraia hortae CBS 480.64]|uniref:F-box domain-containing protein n=1 Tax=Piedraia hortae CBS 480.64 TaxID=1314780 RepID=A0A6A7BPA0_9PEZI|nr:hypothetical protein K470DRAFT_224060 [Piedraia hortae CBS 480.64]